MSRLRLPFGSLHLPEHGIEVLTPVDPTGGKIFKRADLSQSWVSNSAALGTDPGSVGNVVGIAPRTLARRKLEKHLSPIESDRLYRLAYVTHVASAVLGGVEAARRWLAGPNRSLGGVVPMTLLDTDIGCRRVEEALVRINYGMYA